ncbi:MAG: YggS family pyridoxal phosphate-dependent enzyme [Bacteroidales bacterium]|nr:YggS family pyridoxal phosphate-dependent enzyme [Bacteroidales bacterium]
MVEDNLRRIYKELPPEVKLVAVSKFHPCEDILEAYRAGQRRFGENRPQEFAAKAVQLPEDIEWHFIGHLQTNKLKMVLPYASLVESIDSRHLLDAVEKWGSEHGRVIDVLLELHLGAEETKGGFTEAEIEEILAVVRQAHQPVPEFVEGLVEGVEGPYPHIRFRGLMGMATNTDDEAAVEADFVRIEAFKKHLDDRFGLPDFTELSIGMSHDWPLAVRHGATIVRIGTAIFGPRIYR